MAVSRQNGIRRYTENKTADTASYKAAITLDNVSRTVFARKYDEFYKKMYDN